VLHLAGSAVSDFYADLSRLYARDCLAATEDPARHDVHVIYVTPDRRWRFPADLSDEAIGSARPMTLAEAVPHLTTLEIDVMVPQMFCLPGMTHYRALFDVLDIPYVGNTPDVMALTSNKAKAKAVVASAGVSVPDGEVLRPGGRAAIAPPAVVKPVDSDNSHGVTLVRESAGYDSALQAAFAHADEALVETFIHLGREVRCGIVVHDGELVCLPLEEYAVDPSGKPVRDAGDKLARDDTGELRLVAKERTKAWIVDPGDPVTESVWEVAKRCHVALGCRDYSLFDFRIDPSGQPWFLEAGLYCSFAETSVIPVMARAAGTPTNELFVMALANALEHERSELT
jgi:D-alanine-D-alanine ligase